MSAYSNVALLAAIATASVAPGDLGRALRSTDSDALDRLGERVGAAGLAPALADDNREHRVAAIRATLGAEDGWAALGALADIAGANDRPSAVEAARAAAAIGDSLDRQRALDEDIPDDLLRAALHRWRAVAGSAASWPDVRVRALEIATDLHRAMGEDATPDDRAFEVDALLVDQEPEIRRAVIELVPVGAHAEAIGERARTDDDPIVALVAATVLCEATREGLAKRDIVAALGDGMNRIEALTKTPDAPQSLRAGARRCQTLRP